VETLFIHFLEVVETGDTTRITKLFEEVARRRVDQGFGASDFLRALLLVYPVVRRVVRKAGPRSDAALAHSFDEVEEAVFKLASVASNTFAANLTRATQKKVSALTELAAGLERRTRTAEAEANVQRELLREAEQFSERVIASLSSGVLVVEHRTMVVRLWGGRMEEITGIRAENALGETLGKVVAPLKGLPLGELVTTVEAMDRLPLTKVTLETAKGQKRVVYLRAERLLSKGEEVKGTVILLDDVTERELLIDSFSRYVSRDVVKRLLSRGHEGHVLSGERKDCSVLFADIRGFTGISERTSLEQLHALINEYFHVMIDEVTAHDGAIDKFIGDKIMAVFAADQGAGATPATSAALAIQARIQQLNAERRAKGQEPIEVGIGINSGTVVMGTVGSQERMSFTVIGDVVNVADRLQSLAAPGEILVGQATAGHLSERFEVEPVGPKQLKGRQHLEEVFRVRRER
jgi:class 3 adenylate cyclase